MQKMGTIGLISIVLLMAMAASWAVTTSCSDSTAYYQCSSKSPGFACLPDSSTGGNTLQNDVTMKIIKGSDGNPKCACANFPGYIEVSGACVKTSCTDTNGGTLNTNACSTTKPKRCVNGQLVDAPTVCGCPAGQQLSPDNAACVTSSGCHWSNPACPANSDCDTTSVPDGVCKAKQGCAFGTVHCTDSQTCDTSSNANGVCKDKPGCQYLNPSCAKGQVCVNNACQSAPSGTSGGDTVLGNGSTTTNSSASGASSPLACCCLPTAGASAVVGLAFLRRKEDEE